MKRFSLIEDLPAHRLSIACVLFATCLLLGCATTQERLYKLNNRSINTVSLTVPGNVEAAKACVREIAKEIKFIERPIGSEDMKFKDEDFILLTNNRLKSGLISLIIGAIAASPTNIGIFFKYNKDDNTTVINITEEVYFLSVNRRHDISIMIFDRLWRRHYLNKEE